MTREYLVFLPGLLCDGAVWRHQQTALARADTFVANYRQLRSITDMARMVLDAVPVQRFSLAGHSMGGRVALEVVRLAPQRVNRLALLDTGMDPIAPGDAGNQERNGRMALLELARREGMRSMGRQWARGMVHPSRVDSPVFEEVLDMLERQTPEIFEAQIHALLTRPNARDVLQTLQCPALFVCGRRDAWSLLARHEQMHAMCPGSRLVVIEDSGHMTTMERPDAVSRALADWLDS